MLVQLNMGEIGPSESAEDSVDHLERDALLVYAGKFKAMDGDVEIKDEDIEKLASNHNTLFAKLGRLASGQPNMKIAPPIQLDHSTKATDTIGRLVGNVRAGMHKLEDGTEVKALFGRAKFLGAENVQKVKDGRWAHLSIGADLEHHKIQELTVTPFPAAAEASLLSKGKVSMAAPEVYKDRGHTCEVGQLDSGSYYFDVQGIRSDGFKDAADAKAKCKEKVDNLEEQKKINDQKAKLSAEGDGMDKEKLKKHLMDGEKMSAEEADKKLAAMSEDECKHMAAEIEKKEVDEDKKAKMTAAKASITKMSGMIADTQKKAKLAQKKIEISARLSKLRSEGKLSPAEIKNIKIVELAAGDDTAIEATLKAYEALEPKVLTGFTGSNKAVDLGKVGGQVRMSELELETIMSMPSRKKAYLKKMEEEKKLAGEENPHKVEVHVDATPHEHNEYMSLEDLYRMMDEGKTDEVKAHMKKMHEGLQNRKQLADQEIGSEDHRAEMSALAETLNMLQTQTLDLAKLAESF